jgi:hypothetical protein
MSLRLHSPWRLVGAFVLLLAAMIGWPAAADAAYPDRPVRIEAAQLGAGAGAIGAALLALDATAP